MSDQDVDDVAFLTGPNNYLFILNNITNRLLILGFSPVLDDLIPLRPSFICKQLLNYHVKLPGNML